MRLTNVGVKKHVRNIAAFTVIPVLLSGISCKGDPEAKASAPAASHAAAAPAEKPKKAVETALAPSASASAEQEAEPKIEIECDEEYNPTANGCPKGMARMSWFCIDRYENHLADRKTGHPYPYYQKPPAHLGNLVAKSSPCEFPQMLVNHAQATEACRRVGKRLCTEEEWKKACFGSDGAETKGRCNEGKRGHPRHVMKVIYPDVKPRNWTGRMFNNPVIGLIGNGIEPPKQGEAVGTIDEWVAAGKPDTNNLPLGLRYLVRGGEYEDCRTSEGVFDMRGNLSEWVKIEEPPAVDAGADAAPSEVEIAGKTMKVGQVLGTNFSDHGMEGCHAADRLAEYSSFYSTGFRCCTVAGH